MTAPLFFSINLQQSPRLAACTNGVHTPGIERFRLAHHWALHLYHYHARVVVAGTAFEVVPGSMTLVPPREVVEYHFQELSPHVFAHFTLPQSPVDGNQLLLPVFYEPGGEFQRFEQSLEAIAEALLLNRLRAEVKLWDLLWELAQYGHQSVSRRHPSLEKALALIEMRLGENISVTALAREVGLSHNHLTRLFQREMGGTIVAYVRRQRAELAKHLLSHTTMPLKIIATQINASDHQSFSALMKKETGHPPSYWRQRGESLQEYNPLSI